NRSFVKCLEKMFEKKAYVGIATHDEKLVFESEQLIREFGLKREEYEFQMLLGVDPELRDLLVKRGHRLRIYVPYGKSWLPYSRRRLKENPSIAQHALRQMLGMKSKSV
ncbi:MAG: proline dehydrogenase, partial [Deltaproteobacteria bacterium]